MYIKERRGEEKFFKDTKLEFNILTLWEMTTRQIPVRNFGN